MSDLAEAITTAFWLVAGFDADLIEIVGLSLRVSLVAVGIAAMIGLPLGAALAVFRFPGRGALIVMANALMGLPPVVVGLIVYILLSRSGPLGVFGLLFTPAAMIIAQIVLILPIIASLSHRITSDLWDEYREQLARITNIIHSAPDTDSMLAEAQDRICELLDAERITIYAADPKTNQLRSVYQSGEGLKAIELPVNYRSIAGYVALTGEAANVPDAYDAQALGAIHAKLAFDPRWDEASGFKTKQLLSVPLKFEGRTYGVLQLVNATDP